VTLVNHGALTYAISILDQKVANCYQSKVSQPVKLSDELVLDARITSKIAERSIAGQIEYWAQLGRAIEPLLRGDKALALCQSGKTRSLAEAISQVDSKAGRPIP
jgi:hypothetical protein